MKLPRRNFLHLAAGAAVLPVLPRIARAQAYPTRPITIVVPFVPGGPSDWLGRLVAERFRSSFGQPVVIENVAGANGSLGVGRVARADVLAPPPLPRKFPIAPILKADSITLAVSRENDGKLRIVHAGWCNVNVVQPDGYGQARGEWRGGSTPSLGGGANPP